MNYLKHTILLMALYFNTCKEYERHIDIISGEIINAYTGEPISGVEVQVIENGTKTKTDSIGRFYLEIGHSKLDSILETGLSFVHPGYRPLEINADFESKQQYPMVPETGEVYIYNRPVQLPDGLPTGDLKGSELNEVYIQNLMNDLYSHVYSEIHSLLIYKNNKLVLEEYFYGNNDTIQFENDVKADKTPEHIQWSRTKKHYIASVNKALTST